MGKVLLQPYGKIFKRTLRWCNCGDYACNGIIINVIAVMCVYSTCVCIRYA